MACTRRKASSEVEATQLGEKVEIVTGWMTEDLGLDFEQWK
jgi:hypothetical protein